MLVPDVDHVHLEDKTVQPYVSSMDEAFHSVAVPPLRIVKGHEHEVRRMMSYDEPHSP